jgi:2-keto-4-pentenoate hydratase/2-oxohepta-3-ene-1,7-dioic acid hydratase in catechol pathway
MKLARFGDRGLERPAVLGEEGRRLDVSEFVWDFDEQFFATGGVERLREWLDKRDWQVAEVPQNARTGCPIARPSKIVCIGLNFRDHAAESGMDLPKEPVIFFKASSALAGPDDPVRIPRGGSKLDWEVELAVVIGAAASYVDEARALEHVAGYALHNDYSERLFQLERGGQWVKGKSADTFAPLGPWLATADAVPDTGGLGMWLDVNGAPRQRSSTANMIFDVPTLVAYVSEFMTLLPGDVISTGTPAGVGLGMKPSPVYLRPGDEVTLGIDRLGQARQRVEAFA